MPIEFREGQAVVSCKGDILVLPFSPLSQEDVMKGVAWCLFQERESGEIGREPKVLQVDDKMCLSEQPGVYIAAENYRSLDVVIEALTRLRDDLEEIEIQKQVEHLPVTVSFVPIKFKTVSVHDVPGRGRVRVCRWPLDVMPTKITGRVVVIDGNLHQVKSVESFGHIRKGQEIGILSEPIGRQSKGASDPEK